MDNKHPATAGPDKSAEQWCKDYERLLPDHHRHTKKLEALLVDVLGAKGIPYHLIEARTKDLSSFREKVGRASKSYANPITELTDLSGLRIITYYQDDADRICDLIQTEFEVDHSNTVEHNPTGAVFGYRSAHYVVRISEERAHLLEWAGLAGLKAEIQVRTVLQHAWAAISHKLQYKREEDVPTPLRRKLFRLSALFELADDEFTSLRNASGTHSLAIDTQLSSGDKNLPIDYVSLSQYIERSPLVSTLSTYAEEVGFDFNDADSRDDSDNETISDLIQLLAISRIRTIAQFDSAMTESAGWAKEYLRMQYIESGSSRENRWHVTAAFVCELLLVRSQIKNLRPSYLTRLGWDDGIASRVFRLAAAFVPSGA